MGYDDNYIGGLSQAGAAMEKASMEVRAVSLKENLTSNLNSARRNVARLEDLLQLLERNPEVDRIMELMQRGF